MPKAKRIVRILWCAGILFAVCGLFRHGDTVRMVFRDTLAGCFTNLLPVLFPYMVISRLIVSLDLFSPLPQYLRMEERLRVPATAPVVWLLGNFCGYPVGAAECASLVQKNKLTKEHAGILCALSSHGNPVYLVQIAGILCWKSASFGWMLLAAQFCFTAVATAVCIWKLHRTGNKRIERNTTFPVPEPVSCDAVFASAIRDSSMACVTVCGSIVFFSIVISLLPPVHLVFSALLAAFLEFTSGVEAGAALGGTVGAAITGFALGCGGLSVLTQIVDRLGNTQISIVPTLLMKCAEGIWMAVAAAVLHHFVPVARMTMAIGNAFQTDILQYIGWAIFTLGIACRMDSFWKKAEFYTPHR